MRLKVVCLLAALGSAPALTQVRDRLVPALGASQRLSGVLGARFALASKELERRLEQAAKEGGEQLAVLVEAGAVMWEGDVQGPRGQLLAKAAVRLAGESSKWRNASSLRRGLSALLAYYEASGGRQALEAARRVADWASRSAPAWWDRDLGPAPLAGVACALFRHTGERRKLTQGISATMDQPQAPRLLRALWENGKLATREGVAAEEVLASLTGLVELYRLTGEDAYLSAAKKGWQQIVAEHRYITGAVGWRGRLRGDGMLPGEPGAEVGDALVTAEWLRLNLELLRVTGESRFGDEIERTVYNHLLALQDGVSGAWAAHAPLLGRRRFGSDADERSAGTGLAMAIARKAVWGTLAGGPAIVLYVPGEAVFRPQIQGAVREIRMTSETSFPERGLVRLMIGRGGSGQYPVYLRAPGWCGRFVAKTGGAVAEGRAGEWLKLERSWREGETIEIEMDMGARWIRGEPSYPGHVALQRGPQVMALEATANPGLMFLHRAAPETGSELQLGETPGRPNQGAGRPSYAVAGLAVTSVARRQVVARTKLFFVPFAEAREYRVWLPEPGRLVLGPVAVTAFCKEATSGDGPVQDSICDERSDTYRTARGNGREGSWYAVELDRPEWVDRIVYRHGKVTREGGWFDTTKGKPIVQVKRSRDGAWETVGRLETYPNTNGKEPPTLVDGQAFELKLSEPLQVVGIRVAGHPGREYSSCAELSAYGTATGTATVSSREGAGSRTRLAQRKQVANRQ